MREVMIEFVKAAHSKLVANRNVYNFASLNLTSKTQLVDVNAG